MNILRELRIEIRFNQRQIAEYLNIHTNTYNNYELGIRQVPDAIKIKLAQFYNVSLDYLITGQERDYVYREKRNEEEQLFDRLTASEKELARAFMLGIVSSRIE